MVGFFSGTVFLYSKITLLCTNVWQSVDFFFSLIHENNEEMTKMG